MSSRLRKLAKRLNQLITKNSDDTYFYLESPLGQFHLFKVIFGKDGSIYVPFPYMPSKQGVLSDRDPDENGVYHLKRGGVLVDYDVKFSHHPDGVCHFRRQAKGRPDNPLPEKKSFPLAGSGRVFELIVYHPEGFRVVQTPKPSNHRFYFDEHPKGLRVTATWVPKRRILDQHYDQHDSIGPTVFYVFDDHMKHVLLLGQDRAPIKSHVLVLHAEPVPLAEGAEGPPVMIFRGAQNEGAKALTFLYSEGVNPPQPSTTDREGSV